MQGREARDWREGKSRVGERPGSWSGPGREGARVWSIGSAVDRYGPNAPLSASIAPGARMAATLRHRWALLLALAPPTSRQPGSPDEAAHTRQPKATKRPKHLLCKLGIILLWPRLQAIWSFTLADPQGNTAAGATQQGKAARVWHVMERT